MKVLRGVLTLKYARRHKIISNGKRADDRMTGSGYDSVLWHSAIMPNNQVAVQLPKQDHYHAKKIC